MRELDEVQSPWPLRVENSQEAGHFFVAARSIEPGELLLSLLAPEAAAVKEAYVTRVCALCFETAASPLVCEGCRYVAYCSQHCKASDAEAHPCGGSECAVLAWLREQPPARLELMTHARLALRTLLRACRHESCGFGRDRIAPDRVSCGPAACGNGFPGDLSTGIEAARAQPFWSDMRSRRKKVAALLMAASEVIAGSSRDAGMNAVSFSFSDVEAMLGAIDCNSFDVWNYGRSRKLGMAFYLTASLFNHSCVPNVARVQRGVQIEFYALAGGANKDEPLCIAYIDPRREFAIRTKELLTRYSFMCRCSRCSQGDTHVQVHSLCPRHIGYLIPRRVSSAETEAAGTEAVWCSVCDVPAVPLRQTSIFV